MDNKNKPLYQKGKLNINALGLYLIVLTCAGYFLFGRNFAEMHLSFPFLDFPIFAGEIMLFICFVLLGIKWRLEHKEKNKEDGLFPSKAGIAFFCYAIFVMGKAFYGYPKWGALAFRDAALFYYPVCAIFGYVFYKESFFGRFKTILFIVLLSAVFITKFSFYAYSLFTVLFLAIILIKKYPNKYIKYALSLILFLTTPFKYIIATSRTMLVGSVASIVFVAAALLFVAKIKKRYKIITIAVLSFFLTVGFVKIADKSAIDSLSKIEPLIKLYHEYKNIIIEAEPTFKMKEVKKLALYNPEAPEVKAEINKTAVKPVNIEQLQILEIPQEISSLNDNLKEIEEKIQEIEKMPIVEGEVRARTEADKPASTIQSQGDKISTAGIDKEKSAIKIKEVREKLAAIETFLNKIQTTVQKIRSSSPEVNRLLEDVQLSIADVSARIDKTKSQINDLSFYAKGLPQPKESKADKVNVELRAGKTDVVQAPVAAVSGIQRESDKTGTVEIVSKEVKARTEAAKQTEPEIGKVDEPVKINTAMPSKTETRVNTNVNVVKEPVKEKQHIHHRAGQSFQDQSASSDIKGVLLSLQILQKKTKVLTSIFMQLQQAEEKAAKETELKNGGRDIGVQYRNMLFRVFIWEDMIREFWRTKPILGFDFGKPLRSKSLEIAGFGAGEWGRDGWVAAHNSYLYIIYRGGVIGIIYIICTAVLLFRIIWRSVKLKSVTGVLLCGALLNWLAAANFLVILELPYNAIPFWSLFGMTFAYLFKAKSY